MKFDILSEYCFVNMGQSPASETYNNNADGLPFYQGNADFGEIHPQTRIWCSAPVKIANKGDLLISVRAPIGALNIATEQCCIGRGLAALTPKLDKCRIKYIYFAIQSQINFLIANGTGSTFKAVNKNTLENLLIPVSSLNKQDEIVNIFEKLNNIINKRKEQLLLMDNAVKSRFIEMFGDVIHNSKKWQNCLFSEITSSRLGKMLDAKQQTGRNSYPYLANFNVQWFRFNLKNLNKMDFDEKDRSEFELCEGDLLVCEGGEIGRCAVWHNELQPCFFQKALHRVRCNRQIILPDYLSWWFRYNCDYGGFAALAGSKATIAHLPGTKLKQLQVVVPPVELQEQFVAFVEQTDKSKLEIQKSLDKLEILKKSLMQQYFG